MKCNFRFSELIAALAHFPGLQTKEYERNQSGIDRGLESVLIQRTNRELATYALVRLRIAAMPELASNFSMPIEGEAGLLAWAGSQGAGGAMLRTAIRLATADNDVRRHAALAALKYYRNREAENPLVKKPWAEAGLRRIPMTNFEELLQYPTPGGFWLKKFETIRRLIATVQEIESTDRTDEQVMQALLEVKGVGPQTASMTALFWLNRTTPIIDGYLARLL